MSKSLQSRMYFNSESDVLSYSRQGSKRTLDEFVSFTRDGVKFKAEEGFRTNFASIPALGRILTSNDDFRIVRPSIIHDKLYSQGIYSRLYIDKLYYDMLRCEGVSVPKAWLMYKAVRIGVPIKEKLTGKELYNRRRYK